MPQMAGLDTFAPPGGLSGQQTNWAPSDGITAWVIRVDLTSRQPSPVEPLITDVWTDIGFRRRGPRAAVPNALAPRPVYPR
jgi:hypothetical protein